MTPTAPNPLRIADIANAIQHVMGVMGLSYGEASEVSKMLYLNAKVNSICLHHGRPDIASDLYAISAHAADAMELKIWNDSLCLLPLSQPGPKVAN